MEDKISKQFKTIDEYKAFCNAQYKTIVSLSEKINKLEKEILDLKSQPKVVVSAPEQTGEFKSSDEETICRTQLYLLKETSLGRELSLEECKKAEIYSKILNGIEQKKKNKGSSAEDLNDQDLINLLENIDATRQ